jgi:microcystin-dependent protein
MKEFQSTTGGRHVYNTDFKNLQELALAMQELFRACGGNFVISGCEATVDDTISVSSGYAYIDGKVRAVSAANELSASNLYIIACQRNGDSIPYADGNNANQYVEYYAEVKNTSSVSGSYIAYNSTTQSFPNLATVFFNYYAVCKKAGSQSIDELTIQKTLTVVQTLLASQGMALDSSGTGVFKGENSIILRVGQYSLMFDNTGAISVKNGDTTLFSFSNGSGSGTITYENITVTQNLKTNKLYLGDVDIENKLVPLGVIQMWAGAVDKIPNNYLLCNGQAIKQSDYSELYNVIGSTFNTAPNSSSGNWAAPSSDMFRLPDLQGRFIVGYYPNNKDYEKIGKAGGEAEHTLVTNELPSHTHSFDDYYGLEDAGSVRNNKVYGKTQKLDTEYFGLGSTDNNNDTMVYYTHDTTITGNGDPHENRPPYYVLAYIMRVK